jgi:hypothetical protein
LFFDLFGRFEKLNLGIKAYFPLRPGPNSDPDFGRRTKLAFYVGYRFRL